MEKVWLFFLPHEFQAKNVIPFEGLYYKAISWLGVGFTLRIPFT